MAAELDVLDPFIVTGNPQSLGDPETLPVLTSTYV
jgi:hypothetical protein